VEFGTSIRVSVFSAFVLVVVDYLTLEILGTFLIAFLKTAPLDLVHSTHSFCSYFWSTFRFEISTRCKQFLH
jgi:hypothetical protein